VSAVERDALVDQAVTVFHAAVFACDLGVDPEPADVQEAVREGITAVLRLVGKLEPAQARDCCKGCAKLGVRHAAWCPVGVALMAAWPATPAAVLVDDGSEAW
jgi:hypothetical protein